MSTEIIFVSKANGGTGLHLSDNEGHSGDGTITTDVHQGDTVKWKISAGGGIDEITNIYPKSTSQDIFSSDPVQQKDGSWKGTVSNNASGSEFYNIDYKIGGVSYTDDPELKIHG